jgi:hypothetical protein
MAQSKYKKYVYGLALIGKLRWPPEIGQVAKRESSLGAAGRPRVRHGQYSEEARS